MKFEKFTIRNFKGISEATLDLVPAGANIFTLIGLNESGKTTILEAINAFGGRHSPDDTKALYAKDVTLDNPASFVPKQRKSNFSGVISVSAIVSFDEGEKGQLVAELEKKYSCKVGSVEDQFKIERSFKFENSDYKRYGSVFFVHLKIRPKGTRKYVEVKSEDEIWKSFAKGIQDLLPRVVYFPTFLFSQPEQIVLQTKKRVQLIVIIER